MLKTKSSRKRNKFHNPKPKPSTGMPSQGKHVGKHSSKLATANRMAERAYNGVPKPENNTKASRHVKNDSGISEMDEGIWAQRDAASNGNSEEASIPKINLGDVNGEDEEYTEFIYGGHGSSGVPSMGPRVTEVIQEDGQMTIEMEVDGTKLRFKKNDSTHLKSASKSSSSLV